MTQPLPPSAGDWWSLFTLFFVIALIAGTIVVGAMVYFAVKNRQRKGKPKFIPETSLSRSRAREVVILASISTVLLFSLAVGSYRLTTSFQYPPPASESLTINVTAFQWSFRFDYPNGATSIGELRLPADKQVIFNVTSLDVMHNFGLPDFKLKIDAIPGMYNTIWITTPSLNGNAELNYTIRCYELCGVGHYDMSAKLVVMDPAAFNQWLNNQIASNATSAGG